MFKFLYTILKPKTKLKKLQEKQAFLLQKAHRVSKKNRKQSDKFIYEANEITKQIDLIITQKSK